MRYISFIVAFLFMVSIYPRFLYAQPDKYKIIIYELAELAYNNKSSELNNVDSPSSNQGRVSQELYILGGDFKISMLSTEKLFNKYSEIRRYNNNLTRIKDNRSAKKWKIVLKDSEISNEKHQESIHEILRQLNAEEEKKNSKYKERSIAGWKVRIDQDLLDDHIYRKRALHELEKQLIRIRSRVPRQVVKQLQTVNIFLYKDKPGVNKNVTAYYSPLYKAVIFHNAKKLYDLSDEQNAVVLHELAHGYHDIVLGYDNIEIIDAYDNAVAAGLYKNVKVQDGRIVAKAYALTNQMEYFAELTESYFSTQFGSFENDYYPFNVYDLKKYDKNGYKLAKKMWRK